MVTYITIPKVISIAHKFRLSDGGSSRASHEGSVPIFGGIAIFFGIICAFLFWCDLNSIKFIVISLVIVFFVGILDDLVGISPLKKLIGQIFAILILIYFEDIYIDNLHGVLGVYEPSNFVAIIFTIFVVIVITNGFNLIDGVDGLASGIGIISSFFFGLVSICMQQIDMAVIAFSLMGALLAFLKYNFHPARIFMGDTGSLVVGMVLSILAINIIQNGFINDSINLSNKGPLFAIVFLAVLLFDSLRVFVVRTSKGLGPLSPGRDHIHHALLDLGFGHKKTSIIIYIVSLLLIGGSYFLVQLNINLGIAVLAFSSYILLVIPFYFLRRKRK